MSPPGDSGKAFLLTSVGMATLIGVVTALCSAMFTKSQLQSVHWLGMTTIVCSVTRFISSATASKHNLQQGQHERQHVYKYHSKVQVSTVGCMVQHL